MYNIYHECDDRIKGDHWPYVYLVGKLRDEHTANFAACDCHGGWKIDGAQPLSPGEYLGSYYGRRVLIVLGYRCPAIMSGRIAFADDADAVRQICDVNTWDSRNFHGSVDHTSVSGVPSVASPLTVAAVWYVDGLETPSRPFFLEIPRATDAEIQEFLVRYYLTDERDSDTLTEEVVVKCHKTDAYGDYFVSCVDRNGDVSIGDPILYVTLRDSDAVALGFKR